METEKLKQNLVQEIHSAFDHEADALIAMSEGGAQMLALEEKAARLKKLGFVNCDEIHQVERKMERIKEEQPFYEIAQKYREKYPDLKFITYYQAEDLCKRYNLIIRNASDYIGSVPDKNLHEIEYWREKIDEDDLQHKCFVYQVKVENKNYYHVSQGRSPLPMSKIREAFYEKGFSENQFLDEDVQSIVKYDSTKLVIAAPESMFKNKPKTPQAKDPIVLQPVKDGYLVIAKWGLEANDELLIIPELNLTT
jgi:hypothetical protein